jgi:hypothetical protein
MTDMHMLTTVDNPYNPETQWDDWFQFDSSHGYNTPGLLARVTVTSDELSELDQDIARETAIDEIIRENVLGVLKKVKVSNESSFSEG